MHLERGNIRWASLILLLAFAASLGACSPSPGIIKPPPGAQKSRIHKDEPPASGKVKVKPSRPSR
jgi:hypothetical protein